MSFHKVTALTAQNATETVKTTVDTVDVPAGAKRLVGVGSQVSAAGLTTLEDTTHIVELESSDGGWRGGSQQFCMQGIGTTVTSGTAYLPMQIQPCNISVEGVNKIVVSATYNKAQTVNPSTRVQLIYE